MEDKYMNQIKIQKLNNGYESDPNIGKPIVVIDKDLLKLTFKLNYFKFDFKEDDMGEILFNHCYCYRAGSPNDEGFYLSDNSIWNNKNFPKLEWDSFYQVENTPMNYFDSFIKVSEDPSMNTDGLIHYVFFMKEGTFECLAKYYKEEIPTA